MSLIGFCFDDVAGIIKDLGEEVNGLVKEMMSFSKYLLSFLDGFQTILLRVIVIFDLKTQFCEKMCPFQPNQVLRLVCHQIELTTMRVRPLLILNI